MLKGNEAADHRLLPDGESDAMAILQGETRFLVGETELLGFGPYGGDFGGGATRPHQFDGSVQVITASLVRIDHGMGCVGDRETPVITGAVSHIGMQDVVINWVARAEHAVGEDVRMGIAALAGNRVDGFDVLRAKIIQNLADQANSFVLP